MFRRPDRIVVVLVIAVLFLFAAVKIAREYERGVIFRSAGSPGPQGPGPLPPHPDRRPDGQGRPAHGDAERPAAGGHHEGQRPRARERGRVLPDRRAERRDHAGRELHGRDLADRADDAALGARPARPRRAPLRARQDQRDPAGDHRRGDLAVGDQGLGRRGQGRRDPGRHAARDGAAGRGRARAAREGHLGRRRVPGLRAPEGRGRDHGQEPITVQLRYLQTLLEIGASNNSTIVLRGPRDVAAAQIAGDRPRGTPLPSGRGAEDGEVPRHTWASCRPPSTVTRGARDTRSRPRARACARGAGAGHATHGS